MSLLSYHISKRLSKGSLIFKRRTRSLPVDVKEVTEPGIDWFIGRKSCWYIEQSVC